MDASVAWHVEQCTATDRTSASNSEPHTKQRLALCHVAAKVYKKICYATTVPNQKKIERGGDNLSVMSSFIANAHNELYAFYTEKGGILKKNFEQ